MPTAQPAPMGRDRTTEVSPYSGAIFFTIRWRPTMRAHDIRRMSILHARIIGKDTVDFIAGIRAARAARTWLIRGLRAEGSHLVYDEHGCARYMRHHRALATIVTVAAEFCCVHLLRRLRFRRSFLPDARALPQRRSSKGTIRSPRSLECDRTLRADMPRTRDAHAHNRGQLRDAHRDSSPRYCG
jgi:hypothetical protein